MKQDVFLISEKYLKEESLINDNVDLLYLKPAMIVAQEINLQEIIGTSLLKKLKSLVDDDTIFDEENADYKLLLDDYISQFLLWSTTSELQLFISFKTANSGCVQNNDDKKTAVSIQDIEYLKELYANKSRFYEKLLVDYLTKNYVKYPEYPGKCEDGIMGSNEDYSGIYIPSCGRSRHWDYDKN